MEKKIKLIECPRDAMQGIAEFIPTEKKVAYINSVLACGFDTVDFGSFVSPKAIPQMRDTAEVLEQLDLGAGNSNLLAIVANLRGAEDACVFDEISFLGFPFSISETFQQKNTNSSIEESLKRVEEIQLLCRKKRKELVVYISMAFGNPYGEKWNAEVAIKWVQRLSGFGIKKFAMSDTVGVSNPASIKELFGGLIPEFPSLEFGAHLHTTPDKWEEKVKASFEAGCRRFDSAIKGFGGCPMAADHLTGNMPTEHLLDWLEKNKIESGIKKKEFAAAMKMALETFPA